MPHRDIHIDFNHCFQPIFSKGMTEVNLIELIPNWQEVHQALAAMHEMGNVQFRHLPHLEDSVQELQNSSQKLREKFDTLVVLGIGGSALGARAIQEIYQAQKIRDHSPTKKLYIIDTLDPQFLQNLLTKLDPKTTLVNVISKSGSTVETMAQFLFFKDWLKQRLGESKFREHLIMTTDAKKGTLRALCQEEGYQSFEILEAVGGRFSVLSPVGLFPAAFLGVDIGEMLEGAKRMDTRCRIEDPWMNPAAMLAMVIYWFHQNKSCQQIVTFNYVEALRSTVDWFHQLWAESLGKKLNLAGNTVHAGITPIHASGPRDQHSQMQLYMEGPRDKMVMFWCSEDPQATLSIEPGIEKHDSLAYLKGKSFSQIMATEVMAMEQALTENGVPNCKLSIFGANPFSLGQIFMMFEIATVYMGGLLNVNPYDQPGVELGKKYIYGKLGREGFKEYAAKLDRRIKDKRFVV